METTTRTYVFTIRLAGNQWREVVLEASDLPAAWRDLLARYLEAPPGQSGEGYFLEAKLTRRIGPGGIAFY